jgi:hypothetical protein
VAAMRFGVAPPPSALSNNWANREQVLLSEDDPHNLCLKKAIAENVPVNSVCNCTSNKCTGECCKDPREVTTHRRDPRTVKPL